MLFERWPRFAHRHPWWVVLVSFVVLLATGAAFVFGRGEPGTFSGLSGTESQDLIDLLEERFPAAAGDTARVVYHAPNGLREPEMRSRINTLTEELGKLPELVAAGTPYNPPGAISADGTTGFATLQYAASAMDLDDASVDALVDWRELSSGDGLQIEIGGIVIRLVEQESLGNSELFGVGFAALVLFIAFGSLVAVGLPLLTALLGLAPAFFLTGIAMAFVDAPEFSGQFAAMIGIGVGIDYALLILTRYRENLARGMSVAEAVESASATAGRTVVFAGCAVVIALLGLWAVGVPFMGMAASAAALAVVCAVLVAVLVLPALMSIIGARVNRLGVPLLQAGAHEAEQGFGYRLSRTIQRRPVVFLVASSLILGLLALPAIDLRLGASDDGSNPTSFTSRRAYDLLAEGFGVGFNGPILVGAALETDDDVEAFAALPGAISGTQGVAAVTAPSFNADASAGIFTVIPTTSPQSTETEGLVYRLRDELPSLANPITKLHVGGTTAFFIDMGDFIAARMPLFFAAVLGASFLLLVAVFRSILVPLKAALMNILSVAAAYGVLVAIFQWGWGAELLGVDRNGPIESFLPMMMFAVLFGLSMDYEVFLVSRIREEYLRTGDNAEAVARGLSSTTRVISAAAAIMIAVFASFAMGDSRVIKEFAIGLSVAIFLDATLIRLILVPATMQILGDLNWWFPSWLDRIVPKLGGEEPRRTAEAKGSAAGGG